VISFIYTAIAFPYLPDSIPTHFGLDGIPDQYSEKNSIWLLPVFNLFIWFVVLRAKKIIKK